MSYQDELSSKRQLIYVIPATTFLFIATMIMGLIGGLMSLLGRFSNDESELQPKLNPMYTFPASALLLAAATYMGVWESIVKLFGGKSH